MAALARRRLLLLLQPLPLLAQQALRRTLPPPIPRCRFLGSPSPPAPAPASSSPAPPPSRTAGSLLPTSAGAVVPAAGSRSLEILPSGASPGWLLSSPALLHAGAATAPWAPWTTSPADDMVLMLLGANASVFMLWRVLAYPRFIADPYMVWLDMYLGGRLHTLLMRTSSLLDPMFMMKHFTVSLPNVLLERRIHTLLMYAFSHMDPEHLFSNMFGLCFFGSSVASEFGPAYLLTLYVGGALAGVLFYLAEMIFLSTRKKCPGIVFAPSLGASAAVNAIALLGIFLYPKRLIFLNFFVPVPAALVGAGLIAVDLWRVKKGQSLVSGSSHLGGALVAMMAFAQIKGWI